KFQKYQLYVIIYPCNKRSSRVAPALKLGQARRGEHQSSCRAWPGACSVILRWLLSEDLKGLADLLLILRPGHGLRSASRVLERFEQVCQALLESLAVG